MRNTHNEMYRLQSNLQSMSHVGAGVKRIEPLRFLAGCRIQGD